MNIRYFFLLLLSMSLFNTIQADIDIAGDTEEIDFSNMNPFFGGIEYDYIDSSEFDEAGLEGQYLDFRTGKALLGSAVYYRPCYCDGLALSLAYTNTYLRWNDNSFFTEDNYNLLSLNVSAFSYMLDDWEWKANVTANIDTKHFDDFNHYLSWELLLWGRHQLTNCLGVHLGFYAITGMKIDRIYPVIGFDWRCYEKLNIHVVFPTDISFVWEHNPCWDYGVAVRFWHAKHRLDENEALPEGLWEYRNAGLEGFINYHLNDFISANIHGGYTTGGRFKVANKHYENRQRFDYKGAPYFGGEINMGY